MPKEEFNPLALEEQICFPIYATSRLITRLYQPLLDEIGLTYTQYLVMLVLWEEDEQKVTEIGKKLYLNTNTLTPLITKLIEKGLIVKQRADHDERTVIVSLTKAGKALKTSAKCIPEKLAASVDIPQEEAEMVKSAMWKFLNSMED